MTEEKNIQAEIVKRFLEGWSKAKIAREYSSTFGKVDLILRKNGIPRKAKSEIIDLTGQTFGNWKVLYKYEGKTKRTSAHWTCICNICNKEYILDGHSLRSGNSTQCKNCYRTSLRTGYSECPGKLIGNIVCRATKRNIPYYLNPKFLYELFEKQNGKCALSGMDIQFSPLGKSFDHKKSTVSLDRINPSLGYIPENIRWVHKHLNLMRWDFPDKEFLNFVKLVANFDISIIENYIYIPKNNKVHNTKFGWEKCGNVRIEYFNVAKRNAHKKGLEFNIEIEQIWDLFIKQKGKCSLTGLDLILSTRYLQTASLDRIDSSKGYILENCQWLHKNVNLMKVDFDQNYFIELCKIIDQYQNSLKV